MSITPCLGIPQSLFRLRSAPLVRGVGLRFPVLAFAMLAAALMGAFASPAASGAVHQAIEAPERIEATLKSDLPAFDIAWSRHTDQARQALADMIADRIRDNAPMVLSFPDISSNWRPVSVQALRDMNGQLIDRRVLSFSRANYEGRLEAALMDVLDRVRAKRPDAVLGLDGFEPVSGRRTDDQYVKLNRALDFIYLDKDLGEWVGPGGRRQSLEEQIRRADRNLRAAGLDENNWLVMRHTDQWIAIALSELPENLGVDGSSESSASDSTTEGEAEAEPAHAESRSEPEPQRARAPASPDINGDGVVNSQDKAILLSNWGTTEASCDLNGDGKVGSADLAILLASYTHQPPPPVNVNGEFSPTITQYDRSSGDSITLNITSGAPSGGSVVFKLWSTQNSSSHCVHVDSSAPYIYPASVLQSAPLGEVQLQAMVRNSSNEVLATIARNIVVIDSSNSNPDQGQSGEGEEPGDGVDDPDAGWTEFTPGPQTRIVYVSSSEGSDSNTGLSWNAPVKSLSKGYDLLRDGKPDWMLLKRGDVWTNENFPWWNKSGLSVEEPMVIGAYGENDAPRPKIIAEEGTAWRTALSSNPLNYIAITSLHLQTRERNEQDTYTAGIWVQRTGEFFLIEDCLIEGFGNNVMVQGTQPFGRLDFRMRRSILIDPYRPDTGNTNIYIADVDGLLIEENALINTMENEAGGVKHSHGMYFTQSNRPGSAVVRENIIYNARTNITLRGGGVIENNLSIRGGQSIAAVPSDRGEANVYVSKNVVVESRDHWNGQRLGVGIYVGGIHADIKDNIVFGGTDGGSHTGIALENTGGSVRQNTVYGWSREDEALLRPALIIRAPHDSPIAIEKNKLIQTRDQYVVWDRSDDLEMVSYSNNAYFTPMSQRFWIAEDRHTRWFNDWRQDREPNAEWYEVDVSAYPASLQDVINMTAEELAEALRGQRRGNWTADITAKSVNEMCRAAFDEAGN
ncbi:MAG: hypothetical protein EA376_13595 [Phycisphaeraceae bacterium]|nr:MAG: hypothetical protein EA376_13595 [Phycisphaeraceae bacterium]